MIKCSLHFYDFLKLQSDLLMQFSVSRSKSSRICVCNHKKSSKQTINIMFICFALKSSCTPEWPILTTSLNCYVYTSLHSSGNLYLYLTWSANSTLPDIFLWLPCLFVTCVWPPSWFVPAKLTMAWRMTEREWTHTGCTYRWIHDELPSSVCFASCHMRVTT